MESCHKCSWTMLNLPARHWGSMGPWCLDTPCALDALTFHRCDHHRGHTCTMCCPALCSFNPKLFSRGICCLHVELLKELLANSQTPSPKKRVWRSWNDFQNLSDLCARRFHSDLHLQHQTAWGFSLRPTVPTAKDSQAEAAEYCSIRPACETVKSSIADKWPKPTRPALN